MTTHRPADGPSTSADTEEQLAFYRAVAGEYEQHAIEVPGTDELMAAIDGFRPGGEVLELACGSGAWTQQLLGTASTVTAVDGAPEMLARAAARIGPGRPVRFLEADLFSWRPDRRYDAVGFGCWISHVPDRHFEAFWSMVAEALAPGGEVFFYDDHHRTPAELVEGADSPMVERHLTDGTAFKVIKVPHDAAGLEARLRGLGWDITVTSTDGPFYWGHGRLDERR